MYFVLTQHTSAPFRSLAGDRATAVGALACVTSEPVMDAPCTTVAAFLSFSSLAAFCSPVSHLSDPPSASEGEVNFPLSRSAHRTDADGPCGPTDSTVRANDLKAGAPRSANPITLRAAGGARWSSRFVGETCSNVILRFIKKHRMSARLSDPFSINPATFRSDDFNVRSSCDGRSHVWRRFVSSDRVSLCQSASE